MDVLITVLMKTHIYMRSLVMKDKENRDLSRSLFLLLVFFFLSLFFITEKKIIIFDFFLYFPI